MSGFIQESIGLGTIVLAVPVSIQAWQNWKATRRAELAVTKAQETQDLVQKVALQLTPRNGKTVAQVAEDSNDAMQRMEEKIDRHIANVAIHVRPPPRKRKPVRH